MRPPHRKITCVGTWTWIFAASRSSANGNTKLTFEAPKDSDSLSSGASPLGDSELLAFGATKLRNKMRSSEALDQAHECAHTRKLEAGT